MPGLLCIVCTKGRSWLLVRGWGSPLQLLFCRFAICAYSMFIQKSVWYFCDNFFSYLMCCLLVYFKIMQICHAPIAYCHYNSIRTCRTKIEVNQVNLAYLTALFPESEIVREQLTERRTRLKSFATASSSNDSILVGASGDEEDHQQYHSLLSVQVIPTQKLQILFLLMLVS